jgi:predicted alpha-1,2-mannosidase
MTTRVSRREFAALTATAVPGIWLARNWDVSGERPAGPASFINPLIGASTSQALGEGKTFPGPATPFGMVQLGPDTITAGDNAPGYSFEHKTIEGFSFTRMSGVGWYGDFGNLQIVPTVGSMKLACGRVDRPGEGWRSRFRHETESAKINYYSVILDDSGIQAELTAAPRAGMLRFTFPQSSQSGIQIDLARRIGGTSTQQFVKVVGENAIEGWMKCPSIGGGWGNGDGHVGYTVYFHMEFSKPLERFGVWKIEVPEVTFPVRQGLVTDYFQSDAYYELVRHGQVLDRCAEQEGSHLGFFVEFPTRVGEQVVVKSGISFVSVEGARTNLSHDIPGWDFSEVRERGVSLWNAGLAAIEIEGANDTQKVIFSTALYHAMLDPRLISDVDGKYRAADDSIRTTSNYSSRTIFSGWDVFRAEFPLLTLLNPTVINDEINSLVELSQLSKKGYLERWEIMNSYSGCMDGDPATSVILDAFNKGIRRFDVEKAYAACRQTADGRNGETNRPDNEFYVQHGYVPGMVSWTLDNAYYDWCVGNFAALLGKKDDARLFSGRAANYKKIYDPQVQSMRAKDAKANWIPWEGATTFGQGCTESNPEQQTWFVPHDVEGLIQLMGRDVFVERLEKLFENTPASFGWNAYYNHSNEPVHHVPYLFVFAGKPWLTQKWVRRILLNAYKNDVNGIVGNDDVGQISAWYVMSAMGFYPVCPGDNTYILGSPLFSKATIHLPKEWYPGKTFTVTARNQAIDHCYIRSASLNGKPLSRAWITHDEIVQGGTLEFEMGSSPNEQWASSDKDLPRSMTQRENQKKT